MSLPSKHRKLITVNDVKYHYHFNPFRRLERDAYVVIQHASGEGPKLLIQWVGLVVPRHIRSAVEYAISVGWNNSKGDDFEFGCDSFSEPISFHERPSKASRYWFFDQWFADHPDHLFNSPLIGYKADSDR